MIALVNFELVNCNVGVHYVSPVSWGSKIHRLHLCRGVTLPNECPGYGSKQSDGEVLVMCELWAMQSTFSLLLFSGPER